MATVVLAGALDTKGREYAFVRDCLIEAGVTPLVVDTGVLGDPPFQPDISAREVAKAAGTELESLRFGREGSDTRAVAIAAMTQGLATVLNRLYAEGRLDAVMGMGGSGGTNVISGAMRNLPLGVPKVIASTVASGYTRDFVGTRDMTLMYSVTDIAGLNRVSRMILRNAAFAAAGMASGRAKPNRAIQMDRPLVAITMFGITTPGVLRMVEQLEKAGFETIVFHATGSGGQAMEEMIDEGLIDGVIDYTTSELTDEYLGGAFSAGPQRLEAAGRKGIPQVVVPGSIEVLNFGPRETLPAKYDRPERKLIIHNPTVCAVRINREESIALGKIFAQKVSAARGLAAVMIPLNGLDKYEAPGGPWVEPETDAALFDSIRSSLRKDIPIIELPLNINDAEFADKTVETFITLWNQCPKTGAKP
jgi:uncharacterized protein (UPF0261 family)